LYQTAHNEILDCDPTEAIPESKKVSDFVKGITDLKLESTVSVVLGNPRMLHDVQMCQQYLSTTMENRATLRRARIRTSQATNLAERKGAEQKRIKESYQRRTLSSRTSIIPPRMGRKEGEAVGGGIERTNHR
jgi:hypothetical protein